MSVRRKKGNRGKRKKKSVSFFSREKKINKKINQFRKIVLNHDNQNVHEYNKADKLRLQIKNLLRLQSNVLYGQSRKRRYVYYDQTANFKGLYVTWKKETLPLYLELRLSCPKHIVQCLVTFYRAIKTNAIITYNIFF